ncbi:DUF4468 domain-containing protein [Chryseobacterium salivictor]|uniref:DUF4468 domain-containing protein n=1 Tax=Chryseobacterium salivictor TaxID=2547600 RepID=A0A4P6ZD53_9FLAO|nr:DUF4468 domain-containing protein [Chryseobacterium salivictor]QBO57441.1 hypothetical protein NBC122_00605 [Chryseobacterium salivictor]
MIKLILFFTVILSSTVFGQEKFDFSKEKGLSEYVVTVIPGHSAAEIYTKVNEWLQKTYKNPDYVLKGSVVNDYVRFDGVSAEVMCQNPDNKFIFDCIKIKYEIEIYVKDDRYKFSVINLNYYRPRIGAYVAAGWYNLEQTGPTVYNKKGELKGVYKQLHNLPPFFDGLNSSLKEYILNGSSAKSENW